MKTILAFSLIIIFSSCAATKQQKVAEPVRGVWVTNVASDALKSKKDVIETVQLCKKFGINNMYVVVWNNGVTMYPSAVVEESRGIRQSPVYANRDPLPEIIKEGHKQGIKVHAWIEFRLS